jgi:thiamine pyrophosphokinase
MLHFLIVIKFTIELKLFNLFSFYRCSSVKTCNASVTTDPKALAVVKTKNDHTHGKDEHKENITIPDFASLTKVKLSFLLVCKFNPSKAL